MRDTKAQIFAGVGEYSHARKISNNTYQYQLPDGTICTRLHQTDIAKLRPDGVLVLNSGGWRTPTTKDRINQALASRGCVGSDRGIWYLHPPHHDPGIAYNPVRFYDGIEVHPNGTALPGPELTEKRETSLRKQIASYCKAIAALPKLPLPDAGDCWMCSMFHTVPANDGSRVTAWRGQEKQQGKHAGECLQFHLDETYIHGSLLVNAMWWAGYRDVSIACFLNGVDKGTRQVICRTVRRYLQRQFGLA